MESEISLLKTREWEFQCSDWDDVGKGRMELLGVGLRFSGRFAVTEDYRSLTLDPTGSRSMVRSSD